MVSRAWHWVRLHPIVVFVVIFSTLAFLGFRDTREQNEKLKDVVADLEAERVQRQKDQCTFTFSSRAEAEAMWTDILARAGADQATIEILHDGYDDLPEPAGC